MNNRVVVHLFTILAIVALLAVSDSIYQFEIEDENYYIGGEQKDEDGDAGEQGVGEQDSNSWSLVVRRLRRSWYRRTPRRDIIDTAKQARLTGLVNLVGIAGLEETLRGDGPFTVFAPSDRAFEKFAREFPALLEALKNDTDTLTDVLLYHVLPGEELRTFGNAWRGGGPHATALTNATVTTRRYRAGRTGPLVSKVNDAHVTTDNVITSNGVVHVIDTVLVP